MTVLEELEEIFILRKVRNDYKRREKEIVWDKFEFLFDFIKMFLFLCLFGMFFALIVSLLLIGVVENINLDKVFFSFVGLVFCFSVGFVLSDMKKNKKKMLSYLEDLELTKHKVNNLALKDEAFLAFRPHLIKRKRLLLSKRLWIDAMGEVYDSLTGFLKRVVIPLIKDALTF